MRLLKFLTFSLYIVVVIVLAVTSLLDAITGCEGTSLSVYTSWSFTILWILLALLSIVYVCKKRLYANPATLFIHVALLVILCGALTTYLFSTHGTIRLRTERFVNIFTTQEGEYMTMPFSLRLDSFIVDYYEGTSYPSDFISHIAIVDGQKRLTGQASMNRILSYRHYRFYQADYDPDMRGSLLSIAHDPYGIAITYTGYFLLFVAVILFFFQKTSRFRQIANKRTIVFIMILSVVVALILVPNLINKHHTPILNSPLLPIHVTIIVIAYALFAFITLCGITSFISPKQREHLYHVSLTMLYPAVFLLTAGIIVGSVWANVSWGRYWGWDAKEVWALITMMVYALPLHAESIAWFKDARHFHLYVVIAFLTVLMTYFGANYFIPGLHSYA